jgi:hypothetical protein
MAKNKSASRAEAVRQAVDQAFHAPQIPRERISELLDELGQTAGRLRGAVDELRPASEAELKALRAQVRALAARVEALEARPTPTPRKTAARAKPATATRATAKLKKPPATDPGPTGAGEH